MEEETKKPDYSMNQLVFYLLAILTVGEFILGSIAKSSIAGVLLFIAILKAGFIIAYYMNIGRIFSGDDGGNE